MSNKKIFQHFMLIGALTIGAVSSVYAHGNHSSKNYDEVKNQVQSNLDSIQARVNQELKTSLTENISQHLLTQDAHIKIQIVPSAKTNKTLLPKLDGANLLESNLEPSLSDNHMMRKDGVCEISLTFDDYGNIPKLANEEGGILSVTSLQNDNQRKIAQEFIALHEYYHCEFTAMENPVLTPGKSTEFNKQINYAFKDQVSAAALQKISYIDTLNENFADTAAAMNLIMKYGLDNPDFKFVIDSIKTQRHAKYFQSELDSHFTHFSLAQLLEPSNLEKLQQIKIQIHSNPSPTTYQQFSQFALEIANDGTNKILVNNEKMAQTTLSVETIAYSVFKNLNTLLHFNSTSPEFRQTQTPHNLWAPGISRGLTQNIAQNLMNNIDLSNKQFFQKNGNIGPEGAELFSFLEEQINTKISKKDNNDVDKSLKNIKVFQQDIQNRYQVSNFDKKDNNISKEDSLNKIKELRASFHHQHQEKIRISLN